MLHIDLTNVFIVLTVAGFKEVLLYGKLGKKRQKYPFLCAIKTYVMEMFNFKKIIHCPEVHSCVWNCQLRHSNYYLMGTRTVVHVCSVYSGKNDIKLPQPITVGSESDPMLNPGYRQEEEGTACSPGSLLHYLYSCQQPRKLCGHPLFPQLLSHPHTTLGIGLMRTLSEIGTPWTIGCPGMYWSYCLPSSQCRFIYNEVLMVWSNSLCCNPSHII